MRNWAIASEIDVLVMGRSDFKLFHPSNARELHQQRVPMLVWFPVSSYPKLEMWIRCVPQTLRRQSVQDSSLVISFGVKRRRQLPLVAGSASSVASEDAPAWLVVSWRHWLALTFFLCVLIQEPPRIAKLLLGCRKLSPQAFQFRRVCRFVDNFLDDSLGAGDFLDDGFAGESLGDDLRTRAGQATQERGGAKAAGEYGVSHLVLCNSAWHSSHTTGTTRVLLGRVYFLKESPHTPQRYSCLTGGLPPTTARMKLIWAFRSEGASGNCVLMSSRIRRESR